ncbi:MAG: BON domain-containing protein [Thermomonas sp.]
MKMGAMLLTFSFAVAVAGCSDKKAAVVNPQPEAQRADETAVATPQPVQTAPPQLPVPVSVGATPAAGNYRAEQPATATGVYEAVLAGMGPAAADIHVSVNDGMVYLKGTVKNEADYQAANYIARALPGVDEVDQSALKVR